ncbi:LacI family transcriptional regulator [Phaeobacter inhibens]|uniref:LacI family DNA-binding transcriptional regulator n=1 Tax=Phaeobacter inhibens TaxID=221822 RepID=UPI0001633202|nr:LacI family DNA-binding transcriptional regulator [Phaeobacter inhibens]AFO90457.1 transcriptional regulator, lacI family [Phaeobacter inhibens DSM 17395]AUQ45106.1 transcriptional regulator, lacI family [Phaeobacter inhibens]AUQ53417.1 transcriptional regulator, lacI family [Phaeobacter inhibens]AUQ61688.1 transcriptional regulator, lacI family [Phaeobacter inhibens]AUQ77433.1 transcriptional regulator, lacI family [Phaeobacter inhibens]
MAVTLKDVAERAQVSRSAVSRTFTDGASVSEKMRRKVEKAAQELGYSPNALASSLTTGRTKLIGLVSNNFHNPIFLEVFDRFTRRLQDRGLRPLLVNLSDETDPENSVRMLRQYSVDGVVVASSTLPPGFAKAFRDAGVPVVHSFGRSSSTPQVHVVGIDNVECGRMAARTLVARGYNKVAFMGGPQSATSTQDRCKGFTSEMEAHPEITATHSFAEDYSFEAGRREMLRLLQDDPAEAYFCGDDVLSIGALSAIREQGLQVPQDVGVIGLNDMEMARWENIDLTTIHQPIEQIVNSSIELVAAMLDEPDRYPEARIFPCHVVERGTLRPQKT